MKRRKEEKMNFCGKGMINLLTSLTLVLMPLCLLSVAEALKACTLKSSHCHTTDSEVVFHCPARGHYPHPHSRLLYFKCIGPEYYGCECTCRYEQMCFHALSGKCQFFFLPNIHNCTEETRTLHTTVSHKSTKRQDTSSELPKLSDSRTYDFRYRFRDYYKNRLDHTADRTAGELVKRKSKAKIHNSVRSDILSVRQREAYQLADDNSIFPAWAVAVIVLCVVVLLILMVIFLY